MPITINQGGVLHQLSKASTNDGGILRPIYGTPKDNLTLHWGGFSGGSCISSFDKYVNGRSTYKVDRYPILIGECTIDSPTYVSFSCNLYDEMINQYANNVTNLLSLNSHWSGFDNIYLTVKHLVEFKTTKSLSAEKYVSRYKSFTKKYTKNSSGVWETYYGDITSDDIWNVEPISLDDNKYYIYSIKYAYADVTNDTTRPKYFTPIDFSGMEMNLNFKFQTLNGG